MKSMPPNDTSPKRDPRRDPRKGDVLQRGKQVRRVYHIGPFCRPDVPGVHYINKSDKAGIVSWVITDLWRTWAKNAEVLHAAE